MYSFSIPSTFFTLDNYLPVFFHKGLLAFITIQFSLNLQYLSAIFFFPEYCVDMDITKLIKHGIKLVDEIVLFMPLWSLKVRVGEGEIPVLTKLL